MFRFNLYTPPINYDGWEDKWEDDSVAVSIVAVRTKTIFGYMGGSFHQTFIYIFFYSFILYTFINLSSHSIKRVYKCSCIKGLSLKMILPLSSQKGFYPPIFI